MKDVEYGSVDVETGDLFIDFQYEYMSAFNGGYAVVKNNDLYGIIYTEGNIVVDIVYEQMFSVANNYMNQEVLR